MDSVLVVADACFSDQWIRAKGDGRVIFPIDEVARVVQHLERIGAVTAEAYTSEQTSLIREGLLTHIVASTMLGAGDLDDDGPVTYGELDAYLQFYMTDTKRTEQYLIQSPKDSPERPPALLDLEALGHRGIKFVESTAKVERFWVIDANSGRLVAEMAKSGQETRRLHLGSAQK